VEIYLGLWVAKANNKLKTCELQCDLKVNPTLSWLIGGDINEIFYKHEKLGGPQKPQGTLEALQETMIKCGLLDTGFEDRIYLVELKRRGSIGRRKARSILCRRRMDSFIPGI